MVPIDPIFPLLIVAVSHITGRTRVDEGCGERIQPIPPIVAVCSVCRGGSASHMLARHGTTDLSKLGGIPASRAVPVTVGHRRDIPTRGRDSGIALSVSGVAIHGEVGVSVQLGGRHGRRIS